MKKLNKSLNIIILLLTPLIFACNNSSTASEEVGLILKTKYEGKETNILDSKLKEYLALEDDPSTPSNEIAYWLGNNVYAGKSQASPLIVDWSSTKTSKAPYKVTFSTSNSFSDPIIFDNLNVKQCYAYNLVPSTYYYKVEDADGRVSEVDSVKISNSLRIMNTSLSRHNMRDLGGWKCEGGTIKYNMLFRSAEFKDFDDQDKTLLTDVINLKTEVDVRLSSGGESRLESALPLPNVSYYNCGVSDDYSNMLETSKDNVKNFFNLLAKKDAYPLDFHCTQGLDRTGFISLLIEGALGVSDEDIYRDYELTSFFRSKQLRADIVHEGDIWKFRDDGVNSQLYEGSDGLGTGFMKLITKNLGNYYTEDKTISGAITNWLKTVCQISDATLRNIKSLLIENN